VGLSVAKNLAAAFGGTIPKGLEKMVAEGKVGKKSGQGFYKYDAQGKVLNRGKVGPVPADVQERMIGRMLNEAVACLREGVVENEDLLDAGMIFGTGFAPFRGGPIQYAKTRGIENLVHELKELAEKHGERFKPDAGWEKIK
jgi:3-hydroxyacyl-CoA dehydrogenase/enoyl-CoA hydratase/3-hydroxybutyryl-CoA epimerase